MRPKTILVYFVTWPAVGHSVEGIRHAYGYAVAHPGSEIHLVLDSGASFELADLCPWITATHLVDTTLPAPGPDVFRQIPREWDYVVFDRRHYPIDSGAERGGVYDSYRTEARRYFRARIASGGCSGPSVPYGRGVQLRIPLPEESLALARESLRDGPVHIALVPAGGGSETRYPSLASWTRIVEGLQSRFPDLTIELIGKLDAEGNPHTTAFPREHVDALLRRYPVCRDRFDIGLVNQLAVAQRCGVLVSPHTGLAFATLAVGTPWLTISGGRWREFFHVGTPFYSVLPDPARYPAFTHEGADRTTIDSDGSERIVSMCEARIEEDLPELLDAAENLVRGRWTYEHCLTDYERRWATLYKPPVARWVTLHARPVGFRFWSARDRLRSRRIDARLKCQPALRSEAG